MRNLPQIALLLSLSLTVPVTSGAQQPDWFDVPAFVVPELELHGESWKACDGFPGDGEELVIRAAPFTEDILEVLVSDFTDGLHGEELFFRIFCTGRGRIAVQARSRRHSDVMPGTGLNMDLHGIVLVEERAPESDAPLRLRFRLHAVEVQQGNATPTFTEGVVDIPIEEFDWGHRILEPVRPAAASQPDELRQVASTWPDGTLRSRGMLDRNGFRRGAWSTWSREGVKQSESEFLDGEREGRWAGYTEEGLLFEMGRFEEGLRTGAWVAQSGYVAQLTFSSGSYHLGKKEGEWIQRWGDGSLRARGTYTAGRGMGRWRHWWANGRLRAEGDRDRGFPVGEWTYWKEDGSLDRVQTHKLPPWFR